MKTDNQIKVESVNPKQMEAAGKDYLWNTFGTFFYFFLSVSTYDSGRTPG